MRITINGYSRSEPAHARAVPGCMLEVIGLTATMAFVFVLDRATGVSHVQHLYYFPIIFAAIRFGTVAGAVTAGLAILLYHLANPRVLSWSYEESDFLQMAVFVAVGLVAAKLAGDRRRLRRLAMTDDLTGLHNLRSFEVELRSIIRLARRTRTPVSLLMLDVDRLKSLNDEHGHLVGAEAVRSVGRIIAQHIPADAVACRYGGDEFVIAVPRCPGPVAYRIATELRNAVRASVPVLAGLPFPACTLSVSVGVASRFFDAAVQPRESSEDNDDASETLFRAADRALYSAKNGGRDRVSTAVDAMASADRR